MKKIISTFIVLGILFSLHAQESSVLTNKNGTPILPEKGNLAFGINAASLLSIFKDGISEPSFDFVQNNTFTMKYFLSDMSAIRAMFRIGSTSLVVGNADLTNYTSTSVTNMTIGGGYERRLGTGRLQGFYGADGGILYIKEKETDEDDNIAQDESGFGFTLGVFLGSEYFIAPKLSLGGQFSWGASYFATVNNRTERITSGFTLDVDNLGGAILLTFHF